MAVATVPSYVPRQYRRAWLAFLLVAFLGLVSLAAAAKIKVDCGNEYLMCGNSICTGGGKLLTTGRQQYWLVVGDDRVSLPVWAQPIMGELGFRPAECR